MKDVILNIVAVVITIACVACIFHVCSCNSNATQTKTLSKVWGDVECKELETHIEKHCVCRICDNNSRHGRYECGFVLVPYLHGCERMGKYDDGR